MTDFSDYPRKDIGKVGKQGLPPRNPYPAKVGDWKFVCPVEGKTYYGSQAVRRWDGTIVGPRANEPRNPQDMIRPKTETPPPWTRPEPADVFNNVDIDGNTYTSCTIYGRSSKAGYGTAGCSVTGLTPELPLNRNGT